MDVAQKIKELKELPESEILKKEFLDNLTEFGRKVSFGHPLECYQLYMGLKRRFSEEPPAEVVDALNFLRLRSISDVSFSELEDFLKTNYFKSLQFDDESIPPLNDRIRDNFVVTDPADWKKLSEICLTALRANEEALGIRKIIITGKNQEVAPYGKNWLADYDQVFGFNSRSTTDIARYFNQSRNVAQLSKSEQDALRRFVNLYEDIKFIYLLTHNEQYAQAVLGVNSQPVSAPAPEARPQSFGLNRPSLKPLQQAVKPVAPSVVPKLVIPARPAAAVPAPAPVKTPNSTPTPPSAPAEIIPYYATTIVEKIIRAERLAKLSDEQKKRLELIIGQVLRELKTKEDAARTLEASIEQGGVGFAKNQAQRIAGLIVPFAAEARQAVINNNLQKRSLSQQKLRQVGMEINEELQGGKVAPQKTPAPTPSAPAPTTQSKPAPSATPSQAPAAPAAPAPAKNPLTLTRSQDLMQITIVQLRGTSAQAAPSATLAFAANVQSVATQVRAVVAAKQAEPRQLLAFWRQSEPFKTYQEIGRESITTKKPVGAIARERAAARKPYLTEQEFVAVADFTKELQTAAV